MIERYLIGDRDHVALRYDDLLGIPTVTSVADHPPVAAELLETSAAIRAVSAADLIVDAYPISPAEGVDTGSGGSDGPGHLVAEGQRQRSDLRKAGAVVNVRSADACCSHVHNDLAGPGRGRGDVAHQQWLAWGDELQRTHGTPRV